MEKIEEIILRHSQRGMHKLKEYLPEDYCQRAAEAILSWPQGTVFLTTGFYVAGFPETDGPAGTVVLAEALSQLGYRPVIVTDAAYVSLFTMRALDVIPIRVDDDQAVFRALLEQERPVGLISIERCGINLRDDYENMHGVSIRSHNAPIDIMFRLAPAYGIKTIGVGDGGNEIGMGILAQILQKEFSLIPCRVAVDDLVIASVSNWGAYGITAYLAILSRMPLLPEYAEIAAYLSESVKLGSVDGITQERVPHVDGFNETVEQEIVEALLDEVNFSLQEPCVV